MHIYIYLFTECMSFWLHNYIYLVHIFVVFSLQSRTSKLLTGGALYMYMQIYILIY